MALVLSVQVLAVAKITLPPITEETLPNGLKVMVIENHEQPVVAMRLLIKAGTCLDPAGKAGLANMTAGLLRKGTATRDANKISEEIDFVGGNLGVGSDLDQTNATCDILTKHFDVGLGLLSDIILNPKFAPEELERLRKQTMAGIMQAKDDPGTLADQQYKLHLFGDHPYGKPESGTLESVGAFTRDDVVSFWQKYYIPNNSVLIVVGDVKPVDIIGKAKAAFASWKQGTMPEMNFPPAKPITGLSIILINKDDATQSTVKIGSIGIDRHNPDIYACREMNYILGGGGFVSRLTLDIRAKRGLTYDVNSQFSFNLLPGDFTVSTFTRSDSTAGAILGIIELLGGMRAADVTTEELANTKSFYAGYMPLQFETPNQVASQMSLVELYGLGKDYFPNYIDNMDKVTAQDVRRVAQKYIDPKNLLIVVVGKASVIRESLKQIAPVTELDISDL
jgi:zinc protease